MKKTLCETALRLAYIIGIYAFFRLLFLIKFYDRFSVADSLELAMTFIDGVRFNLAGISLFFGATLFVRFLPIRRLRGTTFFHRLTTLLFWASLIPTIVLESIDLELFHHTGRRITVETFVSNQGVQDQLPNLFSTYWPIAILMVSMAALTGWFARWTEYQPNQEPELSPSKVTEVLIWLAVIPLTIQLYRGTFGLRRIMPAHAFQYSSPVVGNLALDSTFNFTRSIYTHWNGTQIAPIALIPAESEAYRFWTGARPSLKAKGLNHEPKQNIVLFILESFSTEYTGLEKTLNDSTPSYTPYLDSIAKQGSFFPNHYANARRSIHSLPGILASIPDWLGTPFISSPFQSTPIYGLGHLGRKNGYKTLFFHGAKNGSMWFDAFSRSAGFEDYFGLNEYQGDSENIEETWGVYDAPFLKFALDQLNQAEAPFISVIYTITSHQPFHLPKSATQFIGKGTQSVHPTILYTDDAVRQFMEAAAQEEWFNRTLFVFTADHTHTIESDRYNHTLGRYDVPLIFYYPGLKLPFPNTQRITQHLDILPTLAEFLGIPVPQSLPFGSSLLSAEGPHSNRALLMESGAYYLVRADQTLVLQTDGETKQQFSWINTNDSSPIAPPVGAQKVTRMDELSSLAQYFRNGLIQHLWYSPSR